MASATLNPSAFCTMSSTQDQSIQPTKALLFVPVLPFPFPSHATLAERLTSQNHQSSSIKSPSRRCPPTVFPYLTVLFPPNIEQFLYIAGTVFSFLTSNGELEYCNLSCFSPCNSPSEPGMFKPVFNFKLDDQRYQNIQMGKRI